MPYAINHNGKAYGPTGPITDINGKPLSPEDIDAYNRQLEVQELEHIKSSPEKLVLYIQHPDKDCTQHTASAQENKGNMYWGVGTWLGTRVANAWVGNKSIFGFQGHCYGSSYRRPVTVRVFDTLYHGWYYESAGDLVRLKKAKKQDMVYAATHRNGN